MQTCAKNDIKTAINAISVADLKESKIYGMRRNVNRNIVKQVQRIRSLARGVT